MVKLIFFQFTIFLFASCSILPLHKSPIKRTPSSIEASHCTSAVEKLLIDRSPLERHRQYQKSLDHTGSDEERKSITLTELSVHITQGNDQFVKGGEFTFKDNISPSGLVSGNRNAGTFRMSQKGKSYFVKKLSDDKTYDELINDILLSKVIYQLGLGPKTELVKAHNSFYLIMEEVPGINIKEVLYPGLSTDSTKERIDAMLGITSADLGEAILNFSKRLLTSDDYLNRLAEIQNILNRNGFYNVDDFQFMIDFSQGPESIQLIDVEAFKRSDLITTSEHSPDKVLSGIIELLAQLAR
jgi:hypothetical protein